MTPRRTKFIDPRCKQCHFEASVCRTWNDHRCSECDILLPPFRERNHRVFSGRGRARETCSDKCRQRRRRRLELQLKGE